MPKIFIKPAVAGHIVRHPEKMQHVIAQDGEWVESSMAWHRKIAHGDVVLCNPPSEVKPKNPPVKAKEGDDK